MATLADNAAKRNKYMIITSFYENVVNNIIFMTQVILLMPQTGVCINAVSNQKVSLKKLNAIDNENVNGF